MKKVLLIGVLIFLLLLNGAVLAFTVSSKTGWVYSSDSCPGWRHPGDCYNCHRLYRELGANFCSKCHSTGSISHPIDVDALSLGIRPLDGSWDPNKEDLSGVRLWDSTGKVVVDSTTATSGYVKCMTCHTPHDAQPGTKFLSILYASPTSSVSPLCQNCHQ